jgi:glucosamine 6-phosphate synthetase-like amidotransferase/phosphosugar isomerase protein
MCGVFGFVSYNGDGPSIARLKIMAKNTERRGPHAFGFAWIDSNDRLRMFKATGRISERLDVLHLLADAKMVIGHCRYATHGKPENNINNHPHPVDGGWLVHNGVISSHAEIAESENFEPVTECDTEILGQLIETGEGTMVERCKQAVAVAQTGPEFMGASVAGGGLVMLGLWNRPNRLIAIRSGNPLGMVKCKENRFYFASNPDCLPEGGTWIDDESVIEFGAKRVKEFGTPLYV